MVHFSYYVCIFPLTLTLYIFKIYWVSNIQFLTSIMRKKVEQPDVRVASPKLLRDLDIRKGFFSEGFFHVLWEVNGKKHLEEALSRGNSKRKDCRGRSQAQRRSEASYRVSGEWRVRRTASVYVRLEPQNARQGPWSSGLWFPHLHRPLPLLIWFRHTVVLSDWKPPHSLLPSLVLFPLTRMHLLCPDDSNFPFMGGQESSSSPPWLFGSSPLNSRPACAWIILSVNCISPEGRACVICTCVRRIWHGMWRKVGVSAPWSHLLSLSSRFSHLFLIYVTSPISQSFL